ncbi:g11868 [Coccomyxa elongata]
MSANDGHPSKAPSSHEQLASNLPKEDHDVPGQGTSITSKLLNMGMSATENFAPLKKVCQHVCAFHFYAHDMSRQVEAHHYCSHRSEEMRQCVIYDSDAPDARLIGIEYIISRRLFEALPPEEKKFWHSHNYEVMSGQLFAPGVPNMAENIEMQKLVDTYGKTWHTWQVDRGDPLPLGPAQLMMAFTDDGQLREDMVADRDRRYGKNSAELREIRQKKVMPPESVAEGANHWQQTALGQAWQTTMELLKFKK